MTDVNRTLLAQEALQLKDIFALRFDPITYGTKSKRKLKLAEPELSTDGGRKARQSITLVPEQETASSRAIVVGWVDVPRKMSELKNFNLAKEHYEARGAGFIDLAREDYEKAVADLQSMFRGQTIETMLVGASSTRTPSQITPKDAPRSSDNAQLIAGGIGVAVGFLLGYIVFGLRILG
jgi:hypothetical protein